ncbi:Vegetative incompatibility protein [Paramyrothecium foliicola]|nr:Vegetative incompatibility protein [Paramyrothecium foliicola]
MPYLLTCVACQRTLAPIDFSINQYRKGQGAARCRLCSPQPQSRILRQNNDYSGQFNYSTTGFATADAMRRPFAQGGFRWAAIANYTSGPRQGQLCVFKWFKAGLPEGDHLSMELKVAETALGIIHQFNKARIVVQPIKLNMPSIWRFQQDCLPEWAGMRHLCEPYIMHFQKFTDNLGWHQRSEGWPEVMQALSHFSYHVTDGQLLLCDLQGGIYAQHVVLTDPCLLSRTRQFGLSDVGAGLVATSQNTHSALGSSMRLLYERDGTFKLTNDLVRDLPKYAILSHTWGPDTDEVTFKDLVDGTGKDKIGYQKIRFCAEQAKRDGLDHFWVDTCCIDKSNNNELSTAINSMFRWYQNSARCYVFLSGIGAREPDLETSLRAHRWFTRGWTLQELIAPASVEFFTQDGQRLGDKRSLEQLINDVTRVAVQALRGDDLGRFDVQERFSWADTRQTTHEEDWAYCLLGIFGIHMPLIYGEGKEHAIRRLKKEIAEATNRVQEPSANKGFWMVPLERNRAFTGRVSELQQLRQTLFSGQQTTKVAVTGLGGIGKTHLVLELIYRLRAEDPGCFIMWIPATSIESINQAFLNAARELGLPGVEDDGVNAMKLVKIYLSSYSAGRWLLVIDNADDFSIWTDKSTEDSSRLMDHLPRSSHGSILFTTRDKKAAVKLAGRDVVTLSDLDEDGAMGLLQAYLIDPSLASEPASPALLAQLTYLPLAIVQAAAYINSNSIGLENYLSLMQDQEEDVIELLSEDFEDEGRYSELKNPVATTWLISFEQICRRDPLAAEYLSFMACVDAKDIPISLLPPATSRKKETDALGTLQGYSFITKQSPNELITIHRLVHLATRNWLRENSTLQDWTVAAIARLNELLRDPLQERGSRWRPLLPHANTIVASGRCGESRVQYAKLCQCYGICLVSDGRYQEAEAPLQRAIEIFKDDLIHDHAFVSGGQIFLSAVYRHLGQWREAEALLLEVIERENKKLTLAGDSILSLICKSLLTELYGFQGRWVDKLRLEFMKRKSARKEDTLAETSLLAKIYFTYKRYDEAERLQLEVLGKCRTAFGDMHPFTAYNMHYLAVTYIGQDRLDMAEQLLTEAQTILLNFQAEDHPQTLSNMSSLLMVYRLQDRIEEAEKLGRQIFKV